MFSPKCGTLVQGGNYLSKPQLSLTIPRGKFIFPFLYSLFYIPFFIFPVLMLSILLPFKNAKATILPCLASIRAQTLSRFEILAINDDSTDNGQKLVEEWPDSRIRLLDNPGTGLVDALNHGLHAARYQFVARMDADDLMRPQRLTKQIGFLAENPDHSLVGCRVTLFPTQDMKAGYRQYIRWQNQVLEHNQMLHQQFIESPLAHPSVMFRKADIIRAGGYRKGPFPEDYDLWLRLLNQGYRLAKHPDILLDWRDSVTRLSRTHIAYARQAFDRLRAEYLSKLSALQHRPVAFWGAGRKTRLRAKYLIQEGITPWVWVDIDPRKIGNQIQGTPVIDFDVLAKSYPSKNPFILIYVTNHGARELIQAQLESIGLKVGQDFLAVG